MRLLARLVVVTLLGCAPASAQNIVYQTDFDDLALGLTQPEPGDPGQDGWFSVMAVPPAYGEIQDAIANSGQALHEFTGIDNASGEQTIDGRDLDPPDLEANPIVTLSVDFYCRTSNENAVNAYNAVLRVYDRTHPGYEMIGFNLGGGNGAPKWDTGVCVVLYGFNGSDNNVHIPLSVGQNLSWQTWHTIELVIDQADDTYLSVTVDGESQDLTGRQLPRNFDGEQWLRGQLLERILAQVIPHDWQNPPDETDDDVFWDNLSLTVKPAPPEGDLNGDGCVDQSDLGILLADWGCPTTPVALYDTFGWEAFNYGDLPPQDGWFDDTTNPEYGMVQVIDDPTEAGMGKVILFDPPGTANGSWQGCWRFLDTPHSEQFVLIEWDQYRSDLTDNFWIADDVTFSGWWAIEWDSAAGVSPGGFDTFIPLTEDAWQHVMYVFDLANGTVTVHVDGQQASTGLVDTFIDGISFRLEPTLAGGADGPMYLDNFRIAESADMDCGGDIDGDGDTDQADLGILLAHWGEGC